MVIKISKLLVIRRLPALHLRATCFKLSFVPQWYLVLMAQAEVQEMAYLVALALVLPPTLHPLAVVCVLQPLLRTIVPTTTHSSCQACPARHSHHPVPEVVALATPFLRLCLS